VSVKEFFIKPTPFKRFLFFFFSDIILFTISAMLAFTLKYGFSVNLMDQKTSIEFTLIFFIITKFVIFNIMKLYKITWQYVGLVDLVNLFYAHLISLGIFLIYYVGNIFWRYITIPKSVILADFIFSIILTGGLRLSKRLVIEILMSRRIPEGRNTLIIGAGEIADNIIRDLQRENFVQYKPVAILDNNPEKKGLYLHNIPIIGSVNIIKKAIEQYKPFAIIISNPDLSLKEVRKIYDISKQFGVKEIKRIPKMMDASETEISVKKLSELNIEDLLNREEVKVEKEKISAFIKGKNVLITGAAGSIGSEIAKQIAFLKPEKLLLFEIDETELFFLEKELSSSFPEIKDWIEYIVGDVYDYQKLKKVFHTAKIDIVFHAAAYKHVPLMEYHPDEALKINVIGTYNICKISSEEGVRTVVNISTDKAVKPRSVMGATKRLGEYIAKAFNDISDTQFISVRFGNVLGSRGSVIPIFLEQLKKGGPITVTHPEMKRYFMSIPEAVSLVLEASVIGAGGEIMVLDMGEPIYISKLAEELIRLHGLEPNQDIEIVYTGIRPGEKLFEELLTAEEGTTKTRHERVFIANISQNFSIDEIENIIDQAKEILRSSRDPQITKDFIFNVLQSKVNIKN
jgi:FlaA1/EpsC-like NDP-sugar epimerase